MSKIEIYEVGPRDGLQNLDVFIPTEEKIKLIDELIISGVRHMQITSFVSPKAIPQMKDSMEVASNILDKYKDFDLFALVPNIRGAQTAHEVGMKKIAIVTSLSESHNKANINKTKKESYSHIEDIIKKYPNMQICLDIATAFACPFEGDMKIDDLVDFIGQYSFLGIEEFNICDTIGFANPKKIRDVFYTLKKEFPNLRFLAHIHDTRGMGLVNSLAAIEAGAEGVQSTFGGLGGCPFAPGASGNTSTEDLVFMLESMGYDTGIDFGAILSIAKNFKSKYNGNYSGRHINIEKKSNIIK